MPESGTTTFTLLQNTLTQPGHGHQTQHQDAATFVRRPASCVALDVRPRGARRRMHSRRLSLVWLLAGTLVGTTARGQGRLPAVDTVGPAIVFDGQGLRIRSVDAKRQLRMRGVIQFDAPRLWLGAAPAGTSAFVIRRARMTMDVVLSPQLAMRLMPDFSANGSVGLEDAFVDVSLARATWLRVGRFRTPYGQERANLILDQFFPERSLLSSLTSNRDQGFQLTHETRGRQFEFTAALLNGVPDNASGFTDANADKDIDARVIWRPAQRTVQGAAQGVSLGINGTRGRQTAKGADAQLPVLTTPSGVTWFSYRGGTNATQADGWRERVGGFAQLHRQRLSLNAEVVHNSAELRRTDSRARVTTTGVLALGAWSLTGEPSSQIGLIPRDANGAWQLTARASRVRVSGSAFPTFVEADLAPRAAMESGVALNWYLQRQTKLQLAGELIRFSGGAAGGTNRATERYVTLRMQVIL